MTDDRGRKPVLLFIGQAPELAETREWATACGFVVAEAFSADLERVIVTEDVLDGICSPGDAVLLSLAESAGVPVVSLRKARDVLCTRSCAFGDWSSGFQVSTNPMMHGVRIIDTTL